MGRQRDYKQKLLNARSQEESVAQKNLEFTLAYLHHVETFSRGVGWGGHARQNADRMSSSVVVLAARAAGGKKIQFQIAIMQFN